MNLLSHISFGGGYSTLKGIETNKRLKLQQTEVKRTETEVTASFEEK